MAQVISTRILKVSLLGTLVVDEFGDDGDFLRRLYSRI